MDNDVHVVGISSQAAGHKTLAPLLIAKLNELNASEIKLMTKSEILALEEWMEFICK